MKSKGYREQIKEAKTREGAKLILTICRMKLKGKALKRCEKAFLDWKEKS